MLHVSCSKFSQIANGEKVLKIFQQLTKLPSAMQWLPFLDHPVLCSVWYWRWRSEISESDEGFV